ncbi:hypothetical protein BDM02DRAFT_3132868 [Thelephora ganbajun]|uniref:Uncharacterized protein n=1 Tax=Thelephora ganbajun TaxID=370292 RepID=A0ACB6YZY5_THEGA|nr:hypothetical protein BDM02DRAFT_3132868 [Thelephora ganbajun]
MGVCGDSWTGEPTGGVFEEEVAVDFVDFLKNFDADLFGGGGCGGEDGEPLVVVEEKKRGRVVETEGDCGGESGSEGESATVVEGIAVGSWRILDVDNIEGKEGEEDEQVGRGQKKNGEMIKK